MKATVALGRIGRRTAEFRKKAGMTQELLAERARVGLNTIQMLEGGKAAPMFASMVRISRALGKPLDAFVRSSPSTERTIDTINQDLADLSPVELEAIATVVRTMVLAKRKKRGPSTAT